jgi:hypothetical protein
MATLHIAGIASRLLVIEHGFRKRRRCTVEVVVIESPAQC